VKAEFVSQCSPFLRMKWNWKKFVLEDFGFPLTKLFHDCSIHISHPAIAMTMKYNIILFFTVDI